MDDLISRRAAIYEIEQSIINHDSAIMRITNMTSAQPKIIRCKDCKHWHEDVANFISIQERGACKMVARITSGEFFCALGERKEINSR